MFGQSHGLQGFMVSDAKWIVQLSLKTGLVASPASEHHVWALWGLIGVVVVLIIAAAIVLVSWRRRKEMKGGASGSGSSGEERSSGEQRDAGRGTDIDGGESRDLVAPAPLAHTPKLSLSRTAAVGASATGTSNGSAMYSLCPSLVVSPRTRGGSVAERTFILREHTFSFRPRAASVIRDAADGSDVATVDGACIGAGDRITLRSANRRDLLCEVQQGGEADRIVFNIYSSHQIFFATIEKDAVGESPKFTVKAADGRTLLVFAGSFADKEFRATLGTSDAVVAQAGHGFQPFEDSSHYQVRVAAGADAGLILVCCMVLDEDIAL